MAINTASRAIDLFNAIKREAPTLIILCFQKNQDILMEIQAMQLVKKPSVFCFTNSNESEEIQWEALENVFSYPLNLARREKSIGQRIGSILKIVNATARHRNVIEPIEKGPDNFIMSKNLSRYVMELDQKKVILKRIKNRINDICPKVGDSVRNELQSLLNMIKTVEPGEKYWEDFKKYFENVNPKFIDLLTKKHPSLTPKDLKYCCYLKMNMSNNDITRILGINQESVRTHKYRLKKKMDVSRNTPLETYLKSFQFSTGRPAS